MKTIKTKHLEAMTPEEILENLQRILQYVDVNENFIQNDDGAIVGSTLLFVAEDKYLVSQPNVFEWPMMPMPLPEALKGKIN